MPRLLTADDIIPLVALLPDEERLRLFHWITPPIGDVFAYRRVSSTPDEFSTDDDPLAWEADGWEEFR